MGVCRQDRPIPKDSPREVNDVSGEGRGEDEFIEWPKVGQIMGK